MTIELDDLSRPAVHALLNEHLQNMHALSQTGAGEAFAPAQRLYESFGFTSCGPFGDYRPDPNSVFMTVPLSAAAERGR